MNPSSINEPIDMRAARATGSVAPVGGFGVVRVGFPLLFFAVGVLAHRLVAPYWIGWGTGWFAAVGGFFLLITAASHAVLCRSSAADPVVAILGSMGIRLAGTFAILGGLIFFSPLGRPEAVFNVLFWYITLTVWDLATVAWRRMPAGGVQVVSEAASDQTRGTAT